MEKLLAKGVNISTTVDDKFKNARIIIDFTAPANYQNYAKLAMVADLIENGSHKYSNELQISRQLSVMYGAIFGVTVLRYGNLHTLRIKISFPNVNFLPQGVALESQIIQFLNEIISNPLQVDGQFEQQYFDLHVDNMVNYLNSIKEDRGYYASIQLQKTMYPEDLNRGSFLLGSIEEVKQLDAKGLLEFYQDVIQNWQVTINVAGNFNEPQVVSLFEQVAFIKHRQSELGPLKVINQPVTAVIRKQETYNGNQSILNYGYLLPVYYGDESYFAAVMFNQLFGSFSQSLLFTEIREKNSLAYDIHSNYNSLSGRLTVQAGIEATQIERVQELIQEQLVKIQTGAYDRLILTRIKSSLINQRAANNDRLSTIIEKQRLFQISGINYTDEQWRQQITAVTAEQISEIANQLQLKAIYVLIGQEDANESN